MSGPMHADAGQIRTFVDALFRYADEGTFISLRAFDQLRRDVPPFIIKGVKINGSYDTLVTAAAQAAQECADRGEPAVFAPPICTFTNPDRARGQDLANGLTLSVELDDVDPDVAQRRLEGIIGPATMVVWSGSDWADPATGEIKPKSHIHWRLTEPTSTEEDHERLRQARTLAALLVGADPTGKPVVHPLRWPGSWNRKASPRMARIASHNEGAEINLTDALDALESAVAAAGWAKADMPRASSQPEAPLSDIRSAMAAIPNFGADVHYDLWIRLGYAVYRATGGGVDGFDIWDNWSRISDKYNATETENAWRRIASALSGKAPARTIGAGTIFYLAAQNGWTRPLPFGAENANKARGDWEDYSYSEQPRDEERQAPPPPMEATPLSALDLDHIPPRRWIYGRELVQGYVSVLASPGGVGKTAYTMAAGVSVAMGSSLLGGTIGKPPTHAEVHKQGSVWFYNLEDPMEEMRRRIKATLQHHRVPVASVSDRIYIDSGRDRPLIIATRAQNGDLVASPVVPALVAELRRRKISVLVVDPFVQSHSAEENRNEEMNLVMALWGSVAHQADCAVWLVHHFRKGGKGGDAESIRGAGAIQGAARSMFTISAMSAEEAQKLGVQEDERWQYIRHDNAKQNMAPPAGHASWFRLASVGLGNGTEDYPDGDFVQAVEAWTPPSPWDGMPWPMLERILTKIDKGMDVGEFYALGKQSKDRWAGHVLIDEAGKTEGQAATILKQWKENGILEEGQYASPRQKGGTTGCIRVNQAKFAEMKRDLATKNDPGDAPF